MLESGVKVKNRIILPLYMPTITISKSEKNRKNEFNMHKYNV